ncbi:hypothetical protein [Nostoc sp.]|uniref:hypothetical protein n=1 Tax=Nostoc sp. TaxID=1180 RepID=UPI002FF62069
MRILCLCVSFKSKGTQTRSSCAIAENLRSQSREALARTSLCGRLWQALRVTLVPTLVPRQRVLALTQADCIISIQPDMILHPLNGYEVIERNRKNPDFFQFKVYQIIAKFK